VYLALAETENSALITADLNFFNALKGSRLSTSMIWVEEIKE
jgi:hypothetical protein